MDEIFIEMWEETIDDLSGKRKHFNIYREIKFFLKHKHKQLLQLSKQQ